MNPSAIGEIIDLLTSAHRILVVTGAGISTSSGIPDFRSPEGLYATAEERYHLPYPEAIFDINYFHTNPKPFFLLSKELLDAEIEPTPGHRFLAHLEQDGKTVWVVTQNIDMLHEKAGSKKVVECHGSYRRGRCLSCGRAFAFDEFARAIAAEEIPRCECGGIIKPDVVFFGEELPEDFMKLYFNPPPADLLLVMGTSLTVQPVAGFALSLAPSIPSILVNREAGPHDREFDHLFHGELDEFAAVTSEKLWPTEGTDAGG